MAIAFEAVAVGLLIIALSMAALIVLGPIQKIANRKVPVVGVTLGTLFVFGILIDSFVQVWDEWGKAHVSGIAHFFTDIRDKIEDFTSSVGTFALRTQLALDHLTHVTVHEIVKAFLAPVRQLAQHALAIGNHAYSYAVSHAEALAARAHAIERDIASKVLPGISHAEKLAHAAQALAAEARTFAAEGFSRISGEITAFRDTVQREITHEEATLRAAIDHGLIAAENYTDIQTRALENALERGLKTAEGDASAMVGTLRGDLGALAGDLGNVKDLAAANATRIAEIGAAIAVLSQLKTLVESTVMPAVNLVETNRPKMQATCQVNPSDWQNMIATLIPLVGGFSIVALVEEMVSLADNFLPDFEELIRHG